MGHPPIRQPSHEQQELQIWQKHSLHFKAWGNTDTTPGELIVSLGFTLGSSLACSKKRGLNNPWAPPAAVPSLGPCQDTQALPGALTPRAGDTCFSLNPNPQLRSYKCEHLISVTANVLQQKTRVNKITNYPVLPPLILKAKHSFKPGLYILTVKVSI